MAECGDYVTSPNGDGWVVALKSDHTGNLLVYPHGSGDREGWFVVLEKDATVIPEPPEAREWANYWVAVRRWEGFFENKPA